MFQKTLCDEPVCHKHCMNTSVWIYEAEMSKMQQKLMSQSSGRWSVIVKNATVMSQLSRGVKQQKIEMSLSCPRSIRTRCAFNVQYDLLCSQRTVMVDLYMQMCAQFFKNILKCVSVTSQVFQRVFYSDWGKNLEKLLLCLRSCVCFFACLWLCLCWNMQQRGSDPSGFQCLCGSVDHNGHYTHIFIFLG